MVFVVRTSKLLSISLQLARIMGVGKEQILAYDTAYPGVMFITVDADITSINSLRHLDIALIDAISESELKHPGAGGQIVSFESLYSVDEREQYEHLSHLLHIQKAKRDKK